MIFLEYDFGIMEKPSRTPGRAAVIAPQNVPITNPHNIEAVYSNHFGASATMTDFTLYFLEMGQVPGPKGTIQKQEVKALITLPVMAAAGMIQVLQQVLQAHTQQLEEVQKQMGRGK